MTALVELKGRINEDGELEVELPENFPHGEVIVTIEAVEKDVEEDEKIWDQQFANTFASVFQKMIKMADDAYDAGLTKELDRDADPV